MSSPEESSSPGADSVSHRDLRTYQRYSCILDASCQSTDDVQYLPRCSAEVRDLSRGGLRLFLPRAYDAGTILTIGIGNTREGFLPPLLVKVVHAARNSSGGWTLGCAFVKPLSEEELKSLV